MSIAQGSLVPLVLWCTQIRSSGRTLRIWNSVGICPVYTESMDVVAEMNEENRIHLIQNARHAVCVMQYTDISQHDFHNNQLMVLNQPVPHIVMIDFASASTSTEPDIHDGPDYFNMLKVLKDSLKTIEDDREKRDIMVSKHFGEREVWEHWEDTNWHSTPDPFAWVLDGMDK